MKTILLIAHLIAIATGTGMSIANYINIRIAMTNLLKDAACWRCSKDAHEQSCASLAAVLMAPRAM